MPRHISEVHAVLVCEDTDRVLFGVQVQGVQERENLCSRPGS
jgi:hypothetical protein